MSDREAPHGLDAMDSVGPDDLLLTAYLDEELDAETRAVLAARLKNEPALVMRLDRLGSATRGLDAAFDKLLAVAPAGHLAQLLQRAPTVARSGPQSRRGLPIAVVLAAAVIIFVFGGLAGRFLPLITPGTHGEVNWRDAVAEYQQFTTTDTLAVIPDAPDVLGAELKTISTKLAVALTPENLALKGATLKRVDLFAFDGRALAQLAYLTDSEGPVAFCIIPSGKPDAAAKFEIRNGFNVVYWNDDGRAYMLIGAAARATLERFAATLSAKV